MRPPAAGPATAAPLTGCSRTRSYCSISEVAARKTSAMGTGRIAAGADHGPREHEEVVVVAAHPRGEVVEPEQVAQLVGVLLRALQLVDDGQLLLDHRLAASRHADEGVVQRAPQPHLGRREPDGLVGEAVDGAGDLGRLRAARPRRAAARAAGRPGPRGPRGRSAATAAGSRTFAVSTAADRSRRSGELTERATAAVKAVTSRSSSRAPPPTTPTRTSASGSIWRRRPAASATTLSTRSSRLASR